MTNNPLMRDSAAMISSVIPAAAGWHATRRLPAIEGEIAQADRSREARTIVLPGVMAFGAVIDENYVEAPDMG